MGVVRAARLEQPRRAWARRPGWTCRATRSCRLCFGNERAVALGVPPVAAATINGARPWAARSYVAAGKSKSARRRPPIIADLQCPRANRSAGASLRNGYNQM